MYNQSTGQQMGGGDGWGEHDAEERDLLDQFVLDNSDAIAVGGVQDNNSRQDKTTSGNNFMPNRPNKTSQGAAPTPQTPYENFAFANKSEEGISGGGGARGSELGDLLGPFGEIRGGSVGGDDGPSSHASRGGGRGGSAGQGQPRGTGGYGMGAGEMPSPGMGSDGHPTHVPPPPTGGVQHGGFGRQGQCGPAGFSRGGGGGGGVPYGGNAHPPNVPHHPPPSHYPYYQQQQPEMPHGGGHGTRGMSHADPGPQQPSTGGMPLGGGGGRGGSGEGLGHHGHQEHQGLPPGDAHGMGVPDHLRGAVHMAGPPHAGGGGGRRRGESMMHQGMGLGGVAGASTAAPMGVGDSGLGPRLGLGVGPPMHHGLGPTSSNSGPTSLGASGAPGTSGGGRAPSATFLTREQLREAAAAEVAAQRDSEHALAAMAADDEDLDGDDLGDGCGRGGRKRKALTKEEKEKANRDRNREHARNTRLRKKAYVAKLSQLVMDLSTQRENQARERNLKAVLERERLAVRQGVVRSALTLYGAGCGDVQRWHTLLDEGFVATMPITPFRSFKQHEIQTGQRVLRGVEAWVSDVRSLALCVESIGSPRTTWKAARARGIEVEAQFGVAEKDLLVSGDTVMCRYVFSTRNAVAAGAACECWSEGMLRCTFTDQNKLANCELMYDCMSWMQQLQGAGCEGDDGGDVPIVANTLQMACAPSQEARVITSAAHSMPIVSVNGAWSSLCGYSNEEVVGKNLNLIQGPATDMREIRKLMMDVRSGRPAAVTVTNYHKDGRQFKNYLRVYPLSSSATSPTVTHFLGVFEELPEQMAHEQQGGHLMDGHCLPASRYPQDHHRVEYQ